MSIQIYHYNKHTTWWEELLVGEAGEGTGGIWDMSTPSSQLCCGAKTLKKIVLSKKKRAQNLLKDTEFSRFCNSHYHFLGQMTRTVEVGSQTSEHPGSPLQNRVLHWVQINLTSTQPKSRANSPSSRSADPGLVLILVTEMLMCFLK